jgi:hypothetical protein
VIGMVFLKIKISQWISFKKIQINLGVGWAFTKDKELFIAKKYRQHLEYYTRAKYVDTYEYCRKFHM